MQQIILDFPSTVPKSPGRGYFAQGPFVARTPAVRSIAVTISRGLFDPKLAPDRQSLPSREARQHLGEHGMFYAPKNNTHSTRPGG